MTEMSRHTLAVGDRTAADPIMHDRAHRSEKKSKLGQTSAVVSGFGLPSFQNLLRESILGPYPLWPVGGRLQTGSNSLLLRSPGAGRYVLLD